MKKTCLAVALSIVAIMMSIMLSHHFIQNERFDWLKINEVCSNNKNIELDNWGVTDYFELENKSSEPIDLAGYYIWDGEKDHEKFYLDGCTIAPENYLVLPYNIKKTGEELFLYSADEKLLDNVVIPQLIADEVYARNPYDSKEWGVSRPTPGADNAEIQAEIPQFSKKAGIYDEAFDLIISAEEGATIYYTVDGADPTIESNIYDGFVNVYDPSAEPNRYKSLQNVVRNWLEYQPDENPVDKAFIVKAIACVDGKAPSKIKTATYLIDKEQYLDTVVVSLTSNPDNFFGDNGLCVTGKAYDDWYLNGQEGDEPSANFYSHETEIPIYCEMIFDGISEGQNAGMKVQGASTRKYPSRRFSIYARDKYSGSDYFDSDVFDVDYHSFVLRAEDADAIAQKIVMNATPRVGGQDAKNAAVFLEGEFWYWTYIRPKYSERYIETIYGVDKDNVEVVEETPQEIYDFLNNCDGLENEANYEAFCQLIDIESFIDYEAASIYMNNMDSSESANIRMWRAKESDGSEYGDGRWRWLIYDMDALNWTNSDYYGVEHAYQIDSFTHERIYVLDSYLTDTVFAALFKNESFRNKFYERFVELCDTGFSVDAAKNVLEEYGTDLSWAESFFIHRREYIMSYVDAVYMNY